MKRLVLFILLLTGQLAQSQELPLHVDQVDIYSFIDELALDNQIDINDAIKPYGADIIYEALLSVKKHINNLSARQQKTLERQLSYFELLYSNKNEQTPKRFFKGTETPFFGMWSPLGIYYKDTAIFLNVSPILGADFFFKNDDYYFHRWGGAEIQGRIGNHLSFYANLRDNAESQLVSDKQLLYNGTGGNYKGSEYSDMRGGMNYRWKYGNISLVKDHVEWGSHMNGANIFSDRAPSYVQLKLNLKPVDWFSFNYFHGWLVSDVIDSTRSYWSENGLRRDVMHGKYVSANMYTFMPVKHFNISFGNSVIYSADDPHPAYLIPFFFYKSVDHWLNSTDGAGSYVGQNSQLFINVSSRNLRGVHLYGTLFVDEFKTSRIFDPDVHNFWSYKIGIKSKAFVLNDLYVGLEYTRTNPNTYQHNISTTTFESNQFHLGHYLRDNADELYIMFQYLPIDKLSLKGEWITARKGEEYGYELGSDAIKHAFLEEIKWQEQIFRIGIDYEPFLHMHFTLEYSYRNAQGEDLEIYSPSFYRGSNHIFRLGMKTGI